MSTSNTTRIFAGATNISHNQTTVNVYNAGYSHAEPSSAAASANRTDVTMENVANHSVHLHLQHTENYQCLAHEAFTSPGVSESHTLSDNEGGENEARADKKYTAYRGFKKTLSMADRTGNTRALRRAANVFSKLIKGNPFMEEKSDEEEATEGDVSVKTHHSFISEQGSPWNNAVQDVVDSVHVMAKAATSIRDDPGAASRDITAALPQMSGSFSTPSAPQGYVYDPHHLADAIRSAVMQTVQAHFYANSEMSMLTPHSRVNRNLPVQPFVLAPSDKESSSIGDTWRTRSVGCLSSVPTTPPFNEHVPHPLSELASEGAHNREPDSTASTGGQTNRSQMFKERTMTIHPLLMPPEDRFTPAHRLASLYFTATVESCKIPEFKAEYMYSNGRPSSILMMFKTTYDADRLKELWDSTDRDNTTAPGLARVLLHRGNIFADLGDTSIRDSALHELSSFSLMPHSMS